MVEKKEKKKKNIKIWNIDIPIDDALENTMDDMIRLKVTELLENEEFMQKAITNALIWYGQNWDTQLKDTIRRALNDYLYDRKLKLLDEDEE